MKFFKSLGNIVVKYRFAVVTLWIVAAAIIFWQAPVLSQVAKTDESSFLPEDSQTMQASRLYAQLFPDTGSRSSMILVLTDGGGLNDADRAYARSLGDFLAGSMDKYDIHDVSSPFTDKELETAMLSADGKSAVLKVDLKTSGYKEVTNEAVVALRAAIASGGEAPASPAGLAVNITGDAPLGQEYIDSVQNSLGTTTKITIILIVVILLLIYRSPLAPVLPLATIGLSFLISRGIIAMLTTIGYKVSSFTEIFLIAVLFGAGTDYCLLLISRYREELVAGFSPKEALAAAFPHTSTAILSSGGTVIIGFLGMVLAKFGLFNTTGPSIAIGVGVTVLSVLTLTPALISILGEHIFWPAHPSRNREKELKGSPFWNKLSSVVTKKPMIFLLASLAVFIPFMVLSGSVTRSFDSLKELPKTSDTVAGYEAIQLHFNRSEERRVGKEC
jgi:putative drug exporter of the RND superfamily